MRWHYPPLAATALCVKRFLQSAPAQGFIAWAAALYVSLVARSLRWRVDGEAELLALAKSTPVIISFWHECLPAMPVLFLHARRQGAKRPVVVLASRHRDGMLIGNVMRHLGLGLVSGSTSRGGAAGLRSLADAIAGGSHAALTPDGPRGPRRVCAPGVAQLAGLTGAAIIPCGAYTSHAKTLRSWDKMRLPLPFGRGVLVCGAPIRASRDAWEQTLPEITTALTMAMDRAAALL